MNAPLWSAEDLNAATGVVADFAASGVSIDSRSVIPGDLFVALVGENGDGHAHVAAALAAGAAGAMVHRVIPDIDPKHLLVVTDTLEGLRALACFARVRFTGRLVAVTGSVGKTTTKEMLRTLLATQGAVHAAAASYNNHWGVPLTLARLPADAISCVIEIGMNHAGEIAPLAAMAQPHVGVITSIDRAHIGNMGSLAAIAEEKAELLRALPENGIAILPAESPFLPILRAACGQRRFVTFGTGGEASLHICREDADGSDIMVNLPNWQGTCRIGAPGRHMAINALAALAAMQALGFAPEEGAAALAGFHAVVGRGALRRLVLQGGEALLLDESYNASSVAVRAALAVLRLQPARRRLVVLGDMLELGADGPAEHIGLAGDVSATADMLFACGPLMRLLYDAVRPTLHGAHANDSAALAPIVARAARPGDVILVKGSLGSQMRRVIAALEGSG